MKNLINSFSSDDDFQPFHGGEKDRREFIYCENSRKYEIINGGSDDESSFSYRVK